MFCLLTGSAFSVVEILVKAKANIVSTVPDKRPLINCVMTNMKSCLFWSMDKINRELLYTRLSTDSKELKEQKVFEEKPIHTHFFWRARSHPAPLLNEVFEFAKEDYKPKTLKVNE